MLFALYHCCIHTINMFEKNRYTVVENFIEKDHAKRLCTYLENNALCKDEPNVTNTTNSTAVYGDPVFELLLLDSLEKLQNITNKNLFPTYSYARTYTKDAVLLKHIDRESCEYSISLCLGKDNADWPLMLQTHDTHEKSGISLEIGDALIYKGMELLHWREKYKGEKQVQVFLHYVDRDGPFSAWIFDKRKGLRLT